MNTQTLQMNNLVYRYHRLLMSGGTDCHGEKKIDRKIGIGYGNMNISKHILDEWKL